MPAFRKGLDQTGAGPDRLAAPAGERIGPPPSGTRPYVLAFDAVILASPGIFCSADEPKRDLFSLERRHSVTRPGWSFIRQMPLVVMKSPDSTTKFFMQAVYGKRALL
jgi:hypothetical protein